MGLKAKLCNYIFRHREKNHLRSLRKRNKNANPTIVCNNCIAGVIYHNLGLKFQSPTINLFIKGADYLEFVKYFRYYSNCDLMDISDPAFSYPVGKLIAKDAEHRDITIHFQHYSSFEEAKKKWIERYSRVNWDNIYYIWEFYDTLYDHQHLYEFDALNVDHKILLTHRKFDRLNNAFVVTCYQDDQPVAKILQYNGLTGRRFLDEFDYVSFLNQSNK